jgi:putative membrane protein insertion efficiency factor
MFFRSLGRLQDIGIGLLRGAIIFYRFILSPWLGAPCRFEPSCSAYALEALNTHGALRGSLFALRRICRCHPWGGMGYDPVPLPKSKIVCDYPPR